VPRIEEGNRKGMKEGLGGGGGGRPGAARAGDRRKGVMSCGKRRCEGRPPQREKAGAGLAKCKIRRSRRVGRCLSNSVLGRLRWPRCSRSAGGTAAKKSLNTTGLTLPEERTAAKEKGMHVQREKGLRGRYHATDAEDHIENS